MAAVTRLYARAFADVVFAHKFDAAKAVTDVEQIAELFHSTPQLRTVLESPLVPFDQKLKLLDALIGKLEMSRQMRNFIAVLIEKRRLRLLPEIAHQVKNEINERMGLADAEITSVRELGAEERAALEGQLARTTGKRVRAQYSLDPTLLGGALIKVGSTIYDGSVRGQLEMIKAQIAAS